MENSQLTGEVGEYAFEEPRRTNKVQATKWHKVREEPGKIVGNIDTPDNSPATWENSSAEQEKQAKAGSKIVRRVES